MSTSCPSRAVTPVFERKIELAQLGRVVLNQLQPYINSTMVGNLNEQVRIPTSAGAHLKVHNSMPMVSNIQGQAWVNKQNESGQNGIKLETNMQVAASMAHIQKMNCSMLYLVSGVESIRWADINVPLHAVINADPHQAELISIKMKLPREKTQMATFHTLPTTFTSIVDTRTGLVSGPIQMRTIHNPKLDQHQREMNTVVSGMKAMGISIRVQGFFHPPN